MQIQHRAKHTDGIFALLATVFLALALLTALPGTVAAEGVFYVDITLGDDATGDGSEANPWKTLHHAAEELGESGSNTLYVAPGVYSVANGENADLPINILMIDSQILGDPEGGTIIDLTGASTGWSNGLELNYCSNVMIKDITIRNAANNGVYVHDSFMINISACAIHDNGGAGIYMYNCEDTYYVRGNVLYDNPVGIQIESDIYMTYGNLPEIINNLIFSGTGESLNTGISISTTADLSPTIYHNTIDGAVGTGIAVFNNGETQQDVAPDVQYNIVTNCITGIVLNYTEPTVDYNNLFGNTSDYAGIAVVPANDISQDPEFADPANYDFHLPGTSPCIDAAVTSGITVDLDGNTRPQGTYPDIGCYEYMQEFVGEGVYYVDINNGSDENDGFAPETAWQTLSHAAGMLWEASGITLHVAPGVYSVANGESDKDLEFYMTDSVILGDPGGGTIIDATTTGERTYGLHLWYVDHVTIKNINIRNASLYGIYIYGGGYNTVTLCELYDNGEAGIILYSCDDTTLLLGNRIFDNPTGVHIISDMYASPRLINNLIYNGPNASMLTGIFLETGEVTPAEIISPTIYHNTIAGGLSTTGIVVDNSPGQSVSPDIQYNILSGDTGISFIGTVTPFTVDYNTLYNSGVEYSGFDPTPNNDIHGDPLFADPANYDFHLLGHSPCVDAAVTSTIDVDLDGKIRPQGTYPDIGCYEYMAGDNYPPHRPAYVSPSNFEVFAPGVPVTLQAGEFSDPEGDSHLTTHWLIARADKDFFSSTPSPFNYVAHETDLTSYTLGGENFIEGMAYEWIVGYQDSGSLQYSWSAQRDGWDGTPHEARVFVVGHLQEDPLPPVAPGSDVADYRMVSVNHIPRNPKASDILGKYLDGGYDTTQYRIGIYDCEYGSGAYREYPDFVIAPGGAAWILAREGLNARINGVPVTTTHDVDTGLRYNDENNNGWNMIGPPNDRDYLWEDVEVVRYYPETGQEDPPVRIGDLDEFNPLIDIRLWEWKNGSYDANTTRLVAGQGYWVRAKQPHLKLRYHVAAQATWSNPGVMLAMGWDRVKKTAGRIIPPATAIAADDDLTPPYPMVRAKLDKSSDNSKSTFHVGCFVSTLMEE